MKLRNVLLIFAAVLAGVTLLLAGYEVTQRFRNEADGLELAFAIASVATAIVCLVVLDWARNLRADAPLRAHRSGRDAQDDGDEAERLPLSESDRRLLAAVHALEALASDERGAERTIEDAFGEVARFAGAVRADLWLFGDGDVLEHRAAFRDGETSFGADPFEPVDGQALGQAAEHRKTFEALDGDLGRFLFPLVSNRRCVGVLKVVVPVAGDEEERPNAMQRLSASLSRLVRPFAAAVRAPDLYDQAVVDRLTGLYTRRHFVNRLTEATGQSRRYGEPLAMLLLDVDNFRMINDRYGAETADRALQDIASLVQDNIRDADSGYRYGADEFAVIMPDTDLESAQALGKRLRGVIRAVRPLADEGGKIIVTVSGAIAEFDEDMRGIGPLIANAEEALDEAKRAGHDRVVAWSPDLRAPAGPGLD